MGRQQLQKAISWDGEVAQHAKYPQKRHEDLSVDPPHPQKSQAWECILLI